MQSPRQAFGVPASPLVLDVLDRLGAWTDVDRLASAVDLPPPALDVLLEGLSAHGLIEIGGRRRRGRRRACRGHAVARVVTGGTPVSPCHARRRLRAPRFHGHDRGVTPRPPAELPPRGTFHIALPTPRLAGASLRTALRDRRTHRRFAPGPIPLDAVGTLLGVTFGVQAWAHASEGRLALKTSPSGGARHSLEAYVWARRVDQVPSGLYHYRPGAHVLTRLDDHREPDTVTSWLPAQPGYEDAAIVVVLSSELARVAWRYRSARAYRVVLIECGHLAQTFCLTATALGLAPFCTAALADTRHRTATSGSTAGCSRRCTWLVPDASCQGPGSRTRGNRRRDWRSRTSDGPWPIGSLVVRADLDVDVVARVDGDHHLHGPAADPAVLDVRLAASCGHIDDQRDRLSARRATRVDFHPWSTFAQRQHRRRHYRSSRVSAGIVSCVRPARTAR